MRRVVSGVSAEKGGRYALYETRKSKGEKENKKDEIKMRKNGCTKGRKL